MEGLLFILCIVVFSHVVGWFPLKPIDSFGMRISKSYPLLGRVVLKLNSCGLCQCHWLSVLWLLCSGLLFVNPWLYVIACALSYMESLCEQLVLSLYDLFVVLLNRVGEWIGRM